jgi:hypothetical protein
MFNEKRKKEKLAKTAFHRLADVKTRKSVIFLEILELL